MSDDLARVTGERDRARDLAAHLEEQLARMFCDRGVHYHRRPGDCWQCRDQDFQAACPHDKSHDEWNGIVWRRVCTRCHKGLPRPEEAS